MSQVTQAMMQASSHNAFMLAESMRLLTHIWQPLIDISPIADLDRRPLTITIDGLRQISRAHPVFNQVAAQMPNTISYQLGIGKLQPKPRDFDHITLTHHVARPYRNIEAFATATNLQNYKFEKTEWKHLVKDAKIEIVDKDQHEDLIRFRPKNGKIKGVKYIVAPRSGHFSTLAAPAVQKAIDSGYEVFVNDIHCAAYVESNGKQYGMDHQVDDKIRHIKTIRELTGQNPHAIGICQGGIPLAIATAWLCKDDPSFKPKTWSFFSGPGDVSVTESVVSKLGQNISEFMIDNFSLSSVSGGLPGVNEKVRAGKHQVEDFTNANPGRHMNDLTWIMNFVAAHGSEWVNYEPLTQEMIISLMQQDNLTDLEKAFLHELQFRTEYNTPADQTALSFHDALSKNFKGNFLATGKATYHGKPVSLMDIDIPTLTADADQDNISTIGQSMGILAHMRENIIKSALIIKEKGHFWWAGKTAYEEYWDKIYDWQGNPENSLIPDYEDSMLDDARRVHQDNLDKERKRIDEAKPVQVSMHYLGNEIFRTPAIHLPENPFRLAA